MRKVDYARVHQKLDRQFGALRAERCDAIFQGKASGKSLKARPQLEKAIDAVPRCWLSPSGREQRAP
jgi:hypothetical protein